MLPESVKEMSSARQLSKNAGVITIGRGIAYFINFITIILLARALKPHDYGVFSLGISIIMLLHGINNLGIETALPYFIPRLLAQKKKGRALWVYNRILKIRIATSAIFGVALFLSSSFIASIYNIPLLEPLLQVLSLGFTCYSILYLFQSVFQAFKKITYMMSPDMILAAAKLIMLLLTISLGLIIITIGYVVAIIITLIMVLLIVYKKVLPRVKPEKINFTKVKKYALTVYVSILAWHVATYIGSMIIGIYPEHNAYLNLAQRLGMFLTLPAVSIGMSLFPELSSKLNKENMKKLFRKVTRYTVIISSIMSFYVLATANQLINLFFSSEYAGGVLTLQIMMISLYLQGAFMTLSTLFMGSGRPRKYTIAVIIQAVISTALTIILIQYKSIGAALAITVATFAYGLYLSVNTGYPIKTFIKALIIGLLSSSVAFIGFELGIINLIVVSLMYFLIFFSLGFALKLIRKYDILIVIKALRHCLRRFY